MVQVSPIRMMGFRPTESDAVPQDTAITAWQMEVTAEVMPTHLATSLLGTPTYSIISGWIRELGREYGGEREGTYEIGQDGGDHD